jgi:hypothetical protein
VAPTWRITWLDIDQVGGFVLGGLGDLDGFLIGRLHHHHAAPAGIKPDLLGGAAGQVDQGAPAHVVVDADDDRVPGLPQGHAHAGAERQAAAGGGHSILVEDFAAAGAAAVVVGAIPSGQAGFGGVELSRNDEGECRSDESRKAALDWHFVDQTPCKPTIEPPGNVSAVCGKSKRLSLPHWYGLGV